MLTSDELLAGLNLVRCSKIKSFKMRLNQEDESTLFDLTIQQFKEGNLAAAARGYDYLLHLGSAKLNEFDPVLEEEFERFRNSNQGIVANEVFKGTALAQGGFSKVLMGTWKNKSVAIKKMNPIENKVKYWRNFKHEADFHANLRHPNIIALLGIQVAKDACCLIEEYADGGDLLTAIHSRQALPIAHITRDIASALNFIHQLGYMHCDVKPENILFKNGIVKLADFGSVAPIGCSTAAGTLEYLPRETFYGQRSASSDFYALALTMWQMFTHRRPFRTLFPKNSEEQIKHYIAEGHTEFIPEDIPSSHQRIIQMGFSELEKRPSGEVMLQELNSLCKEEEQIEIMLTYRAPTKTSAHSSSFIGSLRCLGVLSIFKKPAETNNKPKETALQLSNS